MDMQNAIESRFSHDTTMLVPVQKAIEAARQNHILVIFVRIGFSVGYPEVSPQIKSFLAISQLGGMTVADEATQILEAVHPIPNVPVVTKFSQRIRR